MTNEQLKAWLQQQMLTINPLRGTNNCALVALRLDEILNFRVLAPNSGSVKASDPEAIIYTRPIYSPSGSEIKKSLCSDPRVMSRCVQEKYSETVEIILEDNTDVTIIEPYDITAKPNHISLHKSFKNNIIERLRLLPRRKNDGSAHGFVIYTHAQKNIGHIANFLVTAQNEVWFLDAQNYQDPETFISNTPPAGYMEDIFFLQSMPHEGFKPTHNLKQEIGDAKIMLPTTTITTSNGSYPQRKRKATETYEPDFGPGNQACKKRLVLHSSSSSTYSPSFINSHPSTYETVDQVNLNSTTQRAVTLADFGEILAAVNMDDPSMLQKTLVRSLDLNNRLNVETFSKIAKKNFKDFISFSITNLSYRVIPTFIKFGAMASLEHLEAILNSASMDSDSTDAILESLQMQNILIPQELIQLAASKKKPAKCKDGFIPELVKDLKNHNLRVTAPGISTLLDLIPEEEQISTSTTTTTASTENKNSASPRPKLPIKAGDYIEILQPEDNEYYPATVIRINLNNNRIRVCYDNEKWAWENLFTIKYNIISQNPPEDNLNFIDPENNKKFRVCKKDGKVIVLKRKTSSSSSSASASTGGSEAVEPIPATIAVSTTSPRTISAAQKRQHDLDDKRGRLFMQNYRASFEEEDDDDATSNQQVITTPVNQVTNNNSYEEAQMPIINNSSLSAAETTPTQIDDLDLQIALAEKQAAEAEQRVAVARRQAEELRAAKRQKINQEIRGYADKVEAKMQKAISLSDQIVKIKEQLRYEIDELRGISQDLKNKFDGSEQYIDKYVDRNPEAFSSSFKATLIEFQNKIDPLINYLKRESHTTASTTTSSSSIVATSPKPSFSLT